MRERTLGLQVRNLGLSSGAAVMAGLGSVTSLGKVWILTVTWKPLQETVLWPGPGGKSCQHGTALQMAALGPIVLTQGKLIFTTDNNIVCSEKIVR